MLHVHASMMLGAGIDIVDAFILCYGPDDDENEYSRSLAIQLALFGYEITETILVFTVDTLYIVTGPKKGERRVMCTAWTLDAARPSRSMLACVATIEE